MQTRRKFLHGVSTTGVVLLGASLATDADDIVATRAPLGSQRIPLRDGWEFRLDPSGLTEPSNALDGKDGWETVHVPHTWQTLGRSPDYVGIAWYRIRLEPSTTWASQHVRIEFEAVNHSAHVFLNRKQIGVHLGKGYTAFTLDASPHLIFGQENELLVRVDNRPNDRMLPRNKSYDWADDGGIIRPVNLLVTPRTFIERVEIDATPDLSSGSAEIRIRAMVRNATSQVQKMSIHASVRRGGGPMKCCISVRSAPLSESTASNCSSLRRRRCKMRLCGILIPHTYIKRRSS